MPAFKSQKIAIALDMAGCPNRCRHCWLGNPPNRRMSEETLRQVVRQFREWVKPGASAPFVEALSVATWYREPDFSPDYGRLWELEQELSDEGEARRFELLSIWRLARDESYAAWAREIGTQACQITFFGLKENTDDFCRRQGAFRDSLLATERLLAVGIRPRWQLFLTERVAPELAAFEELVRSMGPIDVFVHGFSPDGEGFFLEPLRPTVDVLSQIPAYLVEKTLQHRGQETLEACLGKAEMDWLPELLEEDAPLAEQPQILAYMVTPELDVYSNLGEPMPWWRLGNLEADGLDVIMGRFERDEVLGLQALFHVPVSELARAYGRPDSRLLYERDALIVRWLRMWAEARWAS